MSGAIETVTVDPVERKSDVPAGNTRPTLKDRSAVIPVTSTGPVST